MKSKNILLLFLVLIVTTLSACGSKSDSKAATYSTISAKEAKEMMDKGGVTVVDVRQPEEYAAGHIPGSVLVPNESIGSRQPKALPDLDAVLLVHCHSGVRSRQAARKLSALGYKNVYDFGGIMNWPYQIVRGS